MSQALKRVGVFSLAMLFAGLAGCDRGGAKQQTGATPSRPPAMVTAVPAIARDVPVYLDAIGKTLAVETVSIIPQVGGKVVKVHVKDGAYVTRDQPLFEIDPKPFEAALASAKATLAQNEAELIWVEADFKRTEELKATNVVSPLESDQKRSALAVTRAKIDAAKAAVDTAQLNLNYATINSPLTGRAGARLVDEGNVVKANDAAMLVIQQLDPIYAEFTVTENDLGTVRKFMLSRRLPDVGNEPAMGLKVLVDIPGDSAQILSALGVPATQPSTGPAAPREGTLTFLDNIVQSNTGTVKVRATVPNAEPYFWPGQFVNVRLVLTTKKNAILIPAQAQQIGQQGPFVYVVTQSEIEDPLTKARKPATVAEMRPIVPGQRQGDMVVVEKGVQSGEQVIVTGQMMIGPNSPVTVANQAPPAQTASAATR